MSMAVLSETLRVEQPKLKRSVSRCNKGHTYFVKSTLFEHNLMISIGWSYRRKAHPSSLSHQLNTFFDIVIKLSLQFHKVRFSSSYSKFCNTAGLIWHSERCQVFNANIVWDKIRAINRRPASGKLWMRWPSWVAHVDPNLKSFLRLYAPLRFQFAIHSLKFHKF